MSMCSFTKLRGAFFVLLLVSVAACKKSSDESGATRDNLTRDSIFLYAQQTYLWNESLPAYNVFNPRQYSSLEDEVEAIRSYQPLDHYSFIDEGEVSDEISGGVSGDWGFFPGYGSSSTDLRILYVYPGSPAANAGIERADLITAINGRTSLDGGNSADLDFINKALFGSSKSLTLTVKKPDGTTRTGTITRGSYTIDPVLKTDVFTVGTKKVGYFVFNDFIEIPSEGTNALKVKLIQMLQGFANAGVSELIVDLRYNTGGSVFTANYLSNWLVPAGNDGEIMHSDYFNKTMQSGQATILKNQKFAYNGRAYSYFDIPFGLEDNRELFQKIGGLNLSRVYFLVSDLTASASELLINSLKPVMDVQLIGQPTYGKPVGFFAIHIDKYDLYVPQFQTKNQNGEGDYFNGMQPTQAALEDLSKPFGDPGETYLALALYHSSTGHYPTNIASVSSAKTRSATLSAEAVKELNRKMEAKLFKGMIGDPSTFRHGR